MGVQLKEKDEHNCCGKGYAFGNLKMNIVSLMVKKENCTGMERENVWKAGQNVPAAASVRLFTTMRF